MAFGIWILLNNIGEGQYSYCGFKSKVPPSPTKLSSAGNITRGATTAEMLRGTKVWVPTPGRLRPAPGQKPGWVLGAGGGRPLPL